MTLALLVASGLLSQAEQAALVRAVQGDPLAALALDKLCAGVTRVPVVQEGKIVGFKTITT